MRHATGSRLLQAAWRCVLLALFAASGAAQEASAPQPATGARFAGWDALRDPAFRFNPDERAVLGFSVRTSPGSRAALDGVDAALAAGDLPAAARGLAQVIGRYGDDVVQVAGQTGRWVGAGEWALYQLLVRLPAGSRESLADADARAAVARALAWRDVAALRTLGWALEGLPEGRQATAAAARLLAESGANAMARAAAVRALQTGPDAALAALLERLPAGAAEVTPPFVLPPQLLPQWRREFVVARLAEANPFAQWPTPGEAPMAPILPVVRDGVAYVADSLSITALDVLSGRQLWHHAGPLQLQETAPDRAQWFSFDKYVDGSRKRAVSPYQVASPAVTDDLVIATVQVLETRRELHRFDNIPINWPLPIRHLVALDRVGGTPVWSQTRPRADASATGAAPASAAQAAFLQSFSVAGPPAVADGMVYAAGALTEGAINSYLAAFDAATGTLLWKTFLCAGQQDLTMFNRPFQEHTAAPPLASGGAVYLASNLGVIACVDGWSGRVRWLTGYTSTARMASRSPERDQRRDIPWVNHAPVLEGGRLIVAPLDSSQVLALDPSTGRLVWALDGVSTRLRDVRHDVLGTGDGRVLVASEQHVECFDAFSGAALWTSGLDLSRDDRIVGAMALAGRQLLVPTAVSGLAILDIDAPSTVQWRRWDELSARQGVRRVVPAGAALLLTDNSSLAAAVDTTAALEAALAAGTPEQSLAAAELLLALGRLPEAETRFDLLLDCADPTLAARARTGRLESASRRARSEDTPARWEALLVLAQRCEALWSVAPEALTALHELGASDALTAWLATLAEQDAGRRLDLGSLTPAGSQPVGLLAAQQALAYDAPAAAVARLQRLITDFPDEGWNGARVRDEAARRIDALLAQHGRQLYAAWELQAEAALALTDDAGSLADAEARFPNALAVAEARRAQWRALLDDGREREVFEALGGTAAGVLDVELLGLRAEAARALGEHDFAAVLEAAARAEGARPATWPAHAAPLPALPTGPCERTTLELTSRGTVVFPEFQGRLDAPWDGCLVAAINGPGELLLMEPAGQRVVWRRALPGRASYVTPGGVEVHADGQRLFVQVYHYRTSSGAVQDDLVEALALSDGSTLWSVPLPGEERGTAVAGGLLLRLHEDAEADGRRRFRLSGWGVATGARALQLDLPPCDKARLVVAGRHAVLYTAAAVLRDGSALDVRLSLVDLAQGTLTGSVALPGESPSVAAVLDEPPLLLLTSRTGGTSLDSTLAAFDPEAGELLWNAASLGGLLSRQNLFTTGGGRLALASSVPAPRADAAGADAGRQSGGSVTLLTPVDAQLGLLAPTETGLALTALPGQTTGLAPRLVFHVASDPARIIVADGRTSLLRYSLRLPAAPGTGSRVLHGRDGFALVSDSRATGGGAALRLFDGESGTERYSTAIDDLFVAARPEVALAEGAVLLASGGRVTLIRSSTR